MTVFYVTAALILTLSIFSVPLGISLVSACVVGIALSSDVPMFLVPQKMVEGMSAFPLLAIPFFLLAGDLMTAGGITTRGVNFFNSLFGHRRGSLAYSVVATNIFMSGISGSAVADAAATSNVLIPAMAKTGYRRDFSAALAAASSIAGPIIPPSIALVVYGIVAQTSILDLFIAGYVPGLLIGVALVCYVRFRVVKDNMPGLARASRGERLIAARAGLWTFVTPVLIVLGTVGGVFTVTELGAILVIFALLVGLVAHRELRLRELPGKLASSSVLASNIMVVVGASAVLAYLYVINDVPDQLPNLLLGVTHNKFLLLLFVNLMLLIAGAFLDSTPATIIFVPILLPLMAQIGVDPIQFGLIVVFNLMLGLLHPPLCLSLFITSSVARVPLWDAFKSTLPMLGLLVALLGLITYVPAVTLWLPHLLQGGNP